MTEPPVTTKFTALLDGDTDAAFKRLVDRTGEVVGRVQGPPGRGLRYPGRADVLRALLTIATRNPHVERAVQEQVRADALHQTGVAAEIADVTDTLTRYVPSLSDGEARDHLTEYVVPELRERAAAAAARPVETAGLLTQPALTIARHGAAYGGYELLRPMLDLARRLQVARDALDPREKVVCPRCAQLVRTTGQPGEPTPALEVHVAQDGGQCRN